MKSFFSQILKIINPLLLILYPFAIYYLLTRYSTRIAGLAILFLLSLNYGSRIATHRETARAILIQIAGITILIVASLLSGHPSFILHLPVLINLFLLSQFAMTLFKPPSMIERYARPFLGDLTKEETVYCIGVTRAWVIFFIANFFVIEAIILLGTIQFWTLYTGFISYLIMGLLFTVEYIYRKIRFRKFGKHFIDRILKRCLGTERKA